MKASDIMTLGAATVAHSASLSHALRIMADHRISALPVLGSDDRLVGIITEGDFIRSNACALGELLSRSAADRMGILGSHRVEEIMTKNPTTIGPNAPVGEAVRLMEERSLKRLPVVSDGNVLGIVSRADLLRTLIE
jgi:CBS domain-containing protein